MNIFGCKRVLCELLPSKAPEGQISSGFASMKQFISLLQTTVVYGDEDGRFQPGDTVYLQGDAAKLAFKKYELGGKQVVEIPVDNIVARTKSVV